MKLSGRRLEIVEYPPAEKSIKIIEEFHWSKLGLAHFFILNNSCHKSLNQNVFNTAAITILYLIIFYSQLYNLKHIDIFKNQTFAPVTPYIATKLLFGAEFFQK